MVVPVFAALSQTVVAGSVEDVNIVKIQLVVWYSESRVVKPLRAFGTPDRICHQAFFLRGGCTCEATCRPGLGAEVGLGNTGPGRNDSRTTGRILRPSKAHIMNIKARFCV